MSQQLPRWVFSQHKHCCYRGSASPVLLILKNRCSLSSLNAGPRWIDSLSARRIHFLKALASSLHKSSCWISLFSPQTHMFCPKEGNQAGACLVMLDKHAVPWVPLASNWESSSRCWFSKRKEVMVVLTWLLHIHICNNSDKINTYFRGPGNKIICHIKCTAWEY